MQRNNSPLSEPLKLIFYFQICIGVLSTMDYRHPSSKLLTQKMTVPFQNEEEMQTRTMELLTLFSQKCKMSHLPPQHSF